MARWANRILLLLNVIALMIAIRYFGLWPLLPNTDGIEYKDLITIILAALAVILAAVTIFIAVMAVWGYNAIRESAEKAAREVAKDVAQTVAAREAESLNSLSGGRAPAPDIEVEEELTKALQTGDSQEGGGSGG